jgi:hypothetical protein
MSDQLFVKRGRRYHPWGNGDHWDMDKDAMPIGSFRLIYCPAPGHYRYRYDVSPDSAAWVAAAMVAEHAMQEAMASRVVASPPPQAYTPRQQQLVDQFRRDMAAEGALTPIWWTHGSPAEVAQAGVNAVKQFSPQSP